METQTRETLIVNKRLWPSMSPSTSPTTAPASTSSLPCSRRSSFGKSTKGAVGYDDGSIRIWDSDEGICETTLNGHKGAVTALRYNKAASLLALRCLFRLRGHCDQVYSSLFVVEASCWLNSSAAREYTSSLSPFHAQHHHSLESSVIKCP